MLNNWSNNKRRMHGYPMKRKLCNSKAQLYQLFFKKEIYDYLEKIIDKLYIEKYKPIIITELEKNIIVVPTDLKPIKMIFVGDKNANL